MTAVDKISRDRAKLQAAIAATGWTPPPQPLPEPVLAARAIERSMRFPYPAAPSAPPQDLREVRDIITRQARDAGIERRQSIANGAQRLGYVNPALGPAHLFAPAFDQLQPHRLADTYGTVADGVGDFLDTAVSGLRGLQPHQFPSLPSYDRAASAVRSASQSVSEAAPGIVRSALQAAPEIPGAVMRALPTLAAELTGLPSFQRAEQRARDTDAQEALGEPIGGDVLGVLGETLGAASAIGGFGLGGAVVRGGKAAAATPGALSDDAIRAVVNDAGLATPPDEAVEGIARRVLRAEQIGPVAALAGTGGAGALLVTAGDASAQTPREIEDEILLGSDGSAPTRPDAARARRVGFDQGFRLDWLDDFQRGRKGVGREDVAALRAYVEANPGDRQALADLMEAERAYDPVAWEAGTNPEAFAAGKRDGERGIGWSTAFVSTILGILAKKPNLINAGAGALKGGIYGAGAGEGEVPLEDRVTRAGVDAIIAGGVSAGIPFAAKEATRFADNLPIHLRQAQHGAQNLGARVGIGVSYDGPPAATNTGRFLAPKEAVLPNDRTARDIVAAAVAADAATPPFTYPRPLAGGEQEQQLLRLARSRPEGAAELERSTREAVASRAQAAVASKRVPAAPGVPLSQPADDLLRSFEAGDPGMHSRWMETARRLPAAEKTELLNTLLARIAQGDIPPQALSTVESTQKLTTLGGILQRDARGRLRRDRTGLSEPIFSPEEAAALGDPPVAGKARSKPNRPPARRASPEAAEAIAQALGESRNIGYFAPRPDAPPLSKLPTRKEPGYAARKPEVTGDFFKDLLLQPSTPVKIGALGYAIPITNGLDDFVLDEPPEPPEPLGGREDLRRSVSLQALGGQAEDADINLEALLDTMAAETDDQLQEAAAERARLQREINRLRRSPLFGPNGEDLSAQASRAQDRADRLEGELSQLPSDAAIRAAAKKREAEESAQLRRTLDDAVRKSGILNASPPSR